MLVVLLAHRNLSLRAPWQLLSAAPGLLLRDVSLAALGYTVNAVGLCTFVGSESGRLWWAGVVFQPSAVGEGQYEGVDSISGPAPSRSS